MTIANDPAAFVARLDALPFLPADKRARVLELAASPREEERAAAWAWLEEAERRTRAPEGQRLLREILTTAQAAGQGIRARQDAAAVKDAESADRAAESPADDLLAGL